MIAVVDYKAGNLKSVENALNYLGIKHFISDDADRLRTGDKLIFPGVGNAKAAMEKLNAFGISEMLIEYAKSGRHMLGICLGSQILLDHSVEGDTKTLSIIRGKTLLFDNAGRKIPHMGWNQVTPAIEHPLFKGVPPGSSFYFVHSYYTVPADENRTLCVTEYKEVFASGIYQDNVCAVQFHPEKSGKWGLKMLENFGKL